MQRLSIIALMALTAGPVLAGGPIEVAPEAPVAAAPAAPVHNWAGFFVGGQLGNINASNDFVLDAPAGAFNLNMDASGLEGGVYGGYDWQGAGQLVYGFDAEYNWADADGSDDLVQTGAPTATFTTYVNATAALRGRVGYAMDRTLLYATAGFAWIDYNISESVPGDDGVSTDYTENGWTLGAGIEQAFDGGWSGRIDYRFSDFGTIVQDQLSSQWDLTTSEVRIGLAKRF